MNLPIPEINLDEYTYSLPPDRIAQYPLPERDSSRLLSWKNGSLSQDAFRTISQYLPPDSLLVFNDTRVLHARLLFPKPTGSYIEVFCLEPLEPFREFPPALQQTRYSSWKCLIGNVRKWKSEKITKDFTLAGKKYLLEAVKMNSLGDGIFSVRFEWDPPHCTFGELLEAAGQIPLPPYIHRAAGHDDLFRYQTIFASCDGSVAAPTAGLRFTGPVLDSLRAAGFGIEMVTLHVGLGTFRPVTTPTLSRHIMHPETFSVSMGTLRALIDHGENPIIAIGTTTVRTLESLYWLGQKYLNDPEKEHKYVGQWDPYQKFRGAPASAGTALKALLYALTQRKMDRVTAETRLMILPGYSFRIIDGMVTNFHQPQSTLLLLVAAFLGTGWRTAYTYALREGFRFLSYGDTCLFIRDSRERK
ncbi:MAG: S-adenosylmethionine:tRNA ribosyltransferase-isomerase [bacterium]